MRWSHAYHVFLLSSMPRNGTNLHVSGSGRPRGNRFQPYTANPLPSRNGGQSCMHKDSYYGPNQGLFHHESVVDMVSSGVEGVYDSDCKNSDPTEGNSSIEWESPYYVSVINKNVFNNIPLQWIDNMECRHQMLLPCFKNSNNCLKI